MTQAKLYLRTEDHLQNVAGQSGSPVYQTLQNTATGEVRSLVKGVIAGGRGAGGPGAFTLVTQSIFDGLMDATATMA